jgi:transcriptional regulator with XRE-family HTH domain
MDLKIARIRRERGWTQTKLAEACKTTQQQILKLERGLVDPQLSTLSRVADALGVEIAELFYTRIELEEAANKLCSSRGWELESLSIMELAARCEREIGLPAMHPYWEKARIMSNRVRFFI